MVIQNILFTIIIPTYNRASFIEKTIFSVLNQTYPNFEIIIVDDGSTDNTSKIVRKIKSNKITYYKIENSERAAARNFGTKKSKGKYVTFLDSDDILLPNYFSNAIDILEKFHNPPFFHLGYEIVDSNEKTLYKINELKNDDIFFLIYGNSLSCMGCFLREDTARKFLFNEDRNLSGSEDWELWFRVLANNGIKTDNRISAKIYNHDARSVATGINEKKLVLRKELALKYAFEDAMVQNDYHKYFKKIDAFGESYIALHLALINNRKESIYHLLKFIKNYPWGIFSKRFFVILKHLLFFSKNSIN